LGVVILSGNRNECEACELDFGSAQVVMPKILGGITTMSCLYIVIIAVKAETMALFSKTGSNGTHITRSCKCMSNTRALGRYCGRKHYTLRRWQCTVWEECAPESMGEGSQ